MKHKFGMLVLNMLLISFATTGRAQPEIGLMSVGGALGLANPEGSFGTAVTLEALADLGKIAENVNLNARLGFWSKSEGGASLRDFILGGNVIYFFGESISQLKPFAGGGLSLHFFRTEVDSNTPLFNGGSRTDTELGIDLRGGTLYELNENTDLIAELLFTLGDAEQLQVKVGVLFKLSK